MKEKVSRFTCDLCGKYKEYVGHEYPVGWLHVMSAVDRRSPIKEMDVCNHCLSNPIMELAPKGIG